MSRPRLLDLYAGAGGSAKGYAEAGFEIVGVDIEPQPNFPFEFHQADAMTFPLDGFAVVHASPPCQDHSVLSSLQGSHGTGWMLEATVARLVASGLPWVVENVEGARMPATAYSIVLCGSSFGLGVRRHRRFASNVALMALSCSHRSQPEPVDVTGTGGPATRREGHRGGVHRKPRNLAHAREVMGVAWMSRRELSQAVPPAYTQFIGEQLLQSVTCPIVS